MIRCLVDHFPHLEILKFQSTMCHPQDSTKKQIAEILRLNPQLKELNFSMFKDNNEPFFDFETFRNLIETMQNLEILTLQYFPILLLINNKIQSKSIKRFEIRGLNVNFSPFFFDQLQHFEFILYPKQLTVDFYDFFEQDTTIRKMSINSSGYHLKWSDIILTLLKKATPLLIDIKIDCFGLVSVDHVIHIVSSFKLQKKIILVTMI